MQIHDFIRIYESKSDEELLQFAKDIGELTLEASTALQSELSRRGLTETTLADVVEDRSAQLPAVRALSRGLISTNEFLWDVTRTYRDHFWLFIKLITPVVVIGYFAVQFGREEARAIGLDALRQGALSPLAIFEISIITQASYFGSWMLFCTAYACISLAIAQVTAGEIPVVITCFMDLRTHSWSFLKVSFLLYVFLGIGYFISISVISIPLVIFNFRMSGLTRHLFGYVLSFLAMLVLSRFALAVPAVVLDNFTVRRSISLSDELTHGRWTVLGALIVKSVWGGYIAGMLPFWIADVTYPYVHFQVWVLRVASVAAVILVEPIMFIGFSLMYINASKATLPEMSPVSLQTT
jgi:hypothetical protein